LTFEFISAKIFWDFGGGRIVKFVKKLISREKIKYLLAQFRLIKLDIREHIQMAISKESILWQEECKSCWGSGERFNMLLGIGTYTCPDCMPTARISQKIEEIIKRSDYTAQIKERVTQKLFLNTDEFLRYFTYENKFVDYSQAVFHALGGSKIFTNPAKRKELWIDFVSSPLGCPVKKIDKFIKDREWFLRFFIAYTFILQKLLEFFSAGMLYRVF